METGKTTVQYVSASNVIIDDIVLWDGRTAMATLGGSGIHAVTGMRVWEEPPLGLLAYLGDDFPASMQQDLDLLGVDRAGLICREGLPTPRAWQLFESNGQRTEIFRTSLEEFQASAIGFEQMPAAMQQARGFHVQWGQTIEETSDLAGKLTAANRDALIVLEPSDSCLEQPREVWRPLLEMVDVFLPNLEEAQRLTGRDTPALMARILQDWGARQVVIRMGPQGAWVHSAESETWHIEAVPVTVVDETGAGNALCGGLLTGLGEGLDLLEASQRGVVSASFALEQFGIPAGIPELRTRAVPRLQWARRHTRADR